MSCIYSHEDGAYCDKHSHGAATLSCSGEEDCPDRIVQINADRIRAMTDEELAEWIAYDTSCETCPVKTATDYECHNTDCKTAWLAWLKSPVEESE